MSDQTERARVIARLRTFEAVLPQVRARMRAALRGEDPLTETECRTWAGVLTLHLGEGADGRYDDAVLIATALLRSPAYITSREWYHGGVPGLRPGDLILSPYERGVDSPRAHRPAMRMFNYRPDLVYATPDVRIARGYAGRWPDGTLYRVDPIDPVEPDPASLTSAYTFRRARVLDVLEESIPVPPNTLALRLFAERWAAVVGAGVGRE